MMVGRLLSFWNGKISGVAGDFVAIAALFFWRANFAAGGWHFVVGEDHFFSRRVILDAGIIQSVVHPANQQKDVYNSEKP